MENELTQVTRFSLGYEIKERTAENTELWYHRESTEIIEKKLQWSGGDQITCRLTMKLNQWDMPHIVHVEQCYESYWLQELGGRVCRYL